MRKCTHVLMVVLFSGCLLGGCATKEVVKTEEPVVPAVATAPEKPQPVPAAPKVAPPAPVKAVDVPQPEIVAAPSQKAAPAETVQEVRLETIHFDFDKSDLRDADREILNRNAGILMNTLKKNIQIEGHCDERGSAEYNLALGERRARSAKSYLETLGVPGKRLSVISYGKEKPIDQGHDEEAWSKNRRAEFVNMME